MRLFKSNRNSSQASLPNSHEGSHSPGDSPIHSPAFPPPGHHTAYPGPHYEGPTDLDHQRFQNLAEEPQPHPAHLLSRSQSQRTVNNVYLNRPTVNVVAPPIHEDLNAYPAPLFGNRPQPHTHEKELKKSKRGLFGLHSSSSKETSSTSKATQPLGRSVSTRKASEASIPAYPQIRTSNQPDDSLTQFEAPTHHSPIQPNFSTPTPRQSSRYPPDPQQVEYRTFQPPLQVPAQNNSNPYLPYHPPAEPPSLNTYDPYQARPASQQSFGPPSPLATSQPPLDSRPSTTQTRYSLESSPLLPQQQAQQQGQPSAQQQGKQQTQHQAQEEQVDQQTHQQAMAGGDGSTSGMRQPLSRQSGSANESSHGSYAQHPSSQQAGSRPQLPQQATTMTDHGRSTPPPTKGREDLANMDYQGLFQRHEELQAKYSKVKKYYFEKDAQVTQLQNVVANQRLSMSKTSLDDNGYATRFNRLNGAITQLSFNIRKNWKGVPPWLQQYVNKDAHVVGAKEMTAVGRACITRWIVDEVFDRFFHPDLEPSFSSQLKIVEKNIRKAGSAQISSDEQRDDLTTKLINWRMTTIEGLQDSILTPQGSETRSQLVHSLGEKLTASLQMNLAEPAPPDLQTGVEMIIDIAVEIAVHLPTESRDVCVEYFGPGSYIDDAYMKMETGLPALTNPVPNDFGDQADGASTISGSSMTESGNPRDYPGENDRDSNAPPRVDSLQVGQGSKGNDRKKSIFGGLVNKKPAPSETTPNRFGSTNTSGTMITKEGKDLESYEKAERERSIRFAAFVAVEVRKNGKDGGNILVKAPCYGY